MQTDLNKLHDVYFGKLKGRGVGKTFLKIHTLAGLVEVSEMTKIFILIDKWQDISYISIMIEKIFTEHNLKIHSRMNRGFVCNDKIIRFRLKTKNGISSTMCDIIEMGHDD